MYKYVLGCIYTHYHGGNVFIRFENFKKAGYTEDYYSIFLRWGGNGTIHLLKFRAATHLLAFLINMCVFFSRFKHLLILAPTIETTRANLVLFFLPWWMPTTSSCLLTLDNLVQCSLVYYFFHL